ncbi:MAG: DNA recombination protein RmuC, partial [Pseudomonadota bacterium]|nr:DNA recombination protein RmuC [Pseudomonadota bacterium]
ARVVIVSPSLLLLSIQVIQAVLRDARLREQAHVIQAEVINLMLDMKRLDERVGNLARHFRTTQKDIDDIVTSAQKITKRGEKIEAIGLSDAAPERQLMAGE